MYRELCSHGVRQKCNEWRNSKTEVLQYPKMGVPTNVHDEERNGRQAICNDSSCSEWMTALYNFRSSMWISVFFSWMVTQIKRCGTLASGQYCSVTVRVLIRQERLALVHCLTLQHGSCLTTLLTAMILLRATTAYFSALISNWYHRALTIMRSLWKVSKCGWFQTQANRNLFFGRTEVPQFRQWRRWEVE